MVLADQTGSPLCSLCVEPKTMEPQRLCWISEVAPKHMHTHAHTHTHLKSRAAGSKFETAHTARCSLGGASMQFFCQLKYDSQLFFQHAVLLCCSRWNRSGSFHSLCPKWLDSNNWDKLHTNWCCVAFSGSFLVENKASLLPNLRGVDRTSTLILEWLAFQRSPF